MSSGVNGWRWLAIAAIVAAAVAVILLRGRRIEARSDSRLAGTPSAVPILAVPPSTPAPPVPKDNRHEAKLSPAYLPPAVTNPALRSLVDRRLGLDARVPPDISARLPVVRDAGDAAVLSALLADPTEPDTVRHEVANLLFRSEFAGLDKVLLAVLDNPAEQARIRSWAVQHLGNLLLAGQYRGNRARLIERLRQGLGDRHLEVRRESLLALTQAGDEQARATARAWVAAEGAEADRLRDLAIRCARELELRECIPTIRRYGRDPNEVIRLAALVALSEWGDAESRPAFEDAAQSGSLRLQSVGKAALARLTPPPAAQ